MEWFIYRYWIDDRIYYVIRTDKDDIRIGWLRTDGEEFGGHYEVFRRWCAPKSLYLVKPCLFN
jgi:hypothetical protein